MLVCFIGLAKELAALVLVGIDWTGRTGEKVDGAAGSVQSPRVAFYRVCFYWYHFTVSIENY